MESIEQHHHLLGKRSNASTTHPDDQEHDSLLHNSQQQSNVSYSTCTPDESEEESEQVEEEDLLPPPQPQAWPLFLYYLCHGIQTNITATALYFVLKDVFHVVPGDYSYISSLCWIPSALKPVFAYLSDCCPIRGRRRTPYLAIGIILNVISCNLLSRTELFTTATTTYQDESFDSNEISDDDNHYNNGAGDYDTATIIYLVTMFINSVASVISETAVDSLMAEMAQDEKDDQLGYLQSSIWTYHSAGTLIGSLIPILAFSMQMTPQMVLSMNAMIVSISAATVYFIKEPKMQEYQKASSSNKMVADLPEDGLEQQKEMLLKAFRNPVLLKALAFVFIVSSSPTSSDAFVYYQTDVLGFSPAFLSWTSVIHSAANCVAAFAYTTFMRTWNMKSIFRGIIIYMMLVGLVKICLVERWNLLLGIPDHLFVVVDTLAQGVVEEIIFMPVPMMAAQLAPVGREGTFYALTLSVANFAWAVSHFLSGALSNVFGISSPDNYDHLTNLMWTVAALSLFPLLFLHYVPDISSLLTEKNLADKNNNNHCRKTSSSSITTTTNSSSDSDDYDDEGEEDLELLSQSS